MTNREAIEILGELKKCYLGGIVDAIDMAIEAVKAQESRVLTLEELQSIGETWNKNTPPYLWVEILDAPEWYTDDRMWVPYSFIRDTINVGSEKYNKDSYMKNWRCWTSKPTDDQRKNTPWNKANENK